MAALVRRQILKQRLEMPAEAGEIELAVDPRVEVLIVKKNRKF
jgi:hypothetical protein